MQVALAIQTTPKAFEDSFNGVGGVSIFTRSWHPPGKPRGVVVIAHGFNSHSGQYVRAAEQFVAAGLAVHALDQRGHGRSGGERFHVDSFADYVNDLATFIQRVKSREPGLPVYLLGHSAGGVVASLYALDHQSGIAGLISESFAFRLPAPAFALSLLKGLGRLAPYLRVLKLRNEDFSRDPEVVEAMNRDPLIAGESQTARTVAALVRADEHLTMSFPLIKLPLLILHGTSDRAALPEGSRFFQDAAGSKDKTLKLYDGAFHDLLNDVGGRKVAADMLAWIDGRI